MKKLMAELAAFVAVMVILCLVTSGLLGAYGVFTPVEPQTIDGPVAQIAAAPEIRTAPQSYKLQATPPAGKCIGRLIEIANAYDQNDGSVAVTLNQGDEVTVLAVDRNHSWMVTEHGWVIADSLVVGASCLANLPELSFSY